MPEIVNTENITAQQLFNANKEHENVGRLFEINKFVNILNLILLAFGTLLNVLCIYVFSQKKMIVRKFNWYLLAFSISELIFCFILFINYLHRFISPRKHTLHEINLATTITIDFITHITDSYSNVLALLLSIDRIYAIRNPIRFKKFITNLHAKILINSTLIILILFKIPDVFLCYQNQNETFYIAYCTLIAPIIFNIIPAVVILIINSILIYYKNKAPKRLKRELGRKNNGQSSLHQHLINKKSISRTQKSYYFVIIVLSLWLVLTALPYYTFKTFSLILHLDSFKRYFGFEFVNSEKLSIIRIILSVLFNSNHCINFFVYFHFYAMFRNCIMRKKFSQILFSSFSNKN